MKQLLIIFLLFFQLVSNAQDWAGNYKSGEYANLEIVLNADNSFNFKFGYYSQNRIREYDGKATLTSDGKALCSVNNECKITFQLLANNQITIEASQVCDEEQLYMIGTYSKENSDTQEKNEEQSALSKWNGYYKNLRNGLELTMTVNKEGNLDFVFHSSSDCSKNFDKGTALYLDQLNSATYKDEQTNCYINFAFIDNQLHINGENCDHGFFCIGFDGIYKKVTEE